MRFQFFLLDLVSSKVKTKIVRFLITHHASMSEREIASILKVSHMSVNRTLRKLTDINFVSFITVGKAHLWKVNRKSYAFKALSTWIKDTSNIQEPLEDLKNILLKNLPKILITKVILFGSVAKRRERANSDIDVFILVKDAKGKEKLESSIEKLSNTCFELYGNRLAPYILTEGEMKKRKNLDLVSEINKGIQIFPKSKS